MSEPRQPEKNISLAILPFRFHHGGESMDDLLGIGLADALTIEFHKIENLNVRSVSRVKNVLSKTADSLAAANILEVDYLLEGQIFPARERTRFTAQLLKVRDGSVVWAGQFDEAENDALLLEDLVSARISEAVRPHLKYSTEDFVRDAPPITGSSYKSGDTDEITGAFEEVDDEEESEKAEPLPISETIKPPVRYGLPLAVLLVLIIGVGGFFAWQRGWFSSGNSTLSDRNAPSIIVLPFQNASAKGVDNSLGAGLAESISDSLGNFKNLFVLSANAGRGLSDPNIAPAQIGRDFGVDYLLRGKTEPDSSGGGVRIVPELVSAGDGKVVWTGTFNAPNGDVRQSQSQIVEEVLKALNVKITDAERQKISQRQPNNGLAYELYLAGRYQMATRTESGLKRAIELFSQSLARDSNFALAHVGLADAYSLQYLYQIPPPADAYQKAKKNALRALEINEELAEAHASLGYILFNGERNRAEAERQFRRAIELNPSYATAHHWLSILLSAIGRHDEALAEIDVARKLNPQAMIIVSAKAILYYRAGRFNEAIKQEEIALQIDAGYVPALKGLRWAYTAQKNYAAARETFRREKSFSGATEDQKGWLIIEAQIEAAAGSPATARALLERALADEYVRSNAAAYAWEIALAYADLNEREKTLEWLEKAEAEKDHGILFIEIEPRLMKYSADERFIALANKAKTPL